MVRNVGFDSPEHLPVPVAEGADNRGRGVPIVVQGVARRVPVEVSILSDVQDRPGCRHRARYVSRHERIHDALTRSYSHRDRK